MARIRYGSEPKPPPRQSALAACLGGQAASAEFAEQLAGHLHPHLWTRTQEARSEAVRLAMDALLADGEALAGCCDCLRDTGRAADAVLTALHGAGMLSGRAVGLLSCRCHRCRPPGPWAN